MDICPRREPNLRLVAKPASACNTNMACARSTASPCVLALTTDVAPPTDEAIEPLGAVPPPKARAYHAAAGAVCVDDAADEDRANVC